MSHRFLLIFSVLVSACASGPQEYDGVIGYRTETSGSDMRVIYIDEARVVREKTLAKVAKVCATGPSKSGDPAMVKVTSEEEYVANINFNVPIAIGFVATGDVKGGGYNSTQVMQSVSQNQALTREMKVRKIDAVCLSGAP